MGFLFFFTDFLWCLSPLFKIHVPAYIAQICNFIGVIFIFSSLIYLFANKNEKPTKSAIIIFLSTIASSIVLYGLFFMTHYAFVACVPLLVYSLYQVYLTMSRPTGQSRSVTVLVSIIFVTFLFFIIFDFVGFSNVLDYNMSGFPSMAILLMAIASSLFYWIIITEYRKNKEAAERKELEYQKIKAESLGKAITPHFLFNSLTLVEGSYHTSLNEGDEAIRLVSKNLRAAIDSGNKQLIGIDEEMDHISDFVDLSNLRSGGKVEILFDIGYEDFMVPPLSLETFVENSIKHGRFGEGKQGYIIVRTSIVVKDITIEISDNGCGFNPEKVNPSYHTGIQNAMVRLEMTLGAKTTIASSIGKGTIVSISFKKK